MKKLIVGLLAAFLMTTGLVGFTGSPASAAPRDCPYSGCPKTNTDSTPVVKNKTVKVRVQTSVRGSNVDPTGKITLTVVKIKKNGNLTQVRKIFGRLDSNGKLVFNLKGLAKGKYAYAAEYENNEKKGFAYSSDNGRFRIG